MFLTDSNNIKEVLLFPAMKPIRNEEGAGAVSEEPIVPQEAVTAKVADLSINKDEPTSKAKNKKAK